MVDSTELISYWKMDESSGDMLDAKASNDGTVTGATQNSTGIINTGYDFDASGDYVEVADASAFDVTTTMSAFIWTKTTSTNNNTFAFNRWQHDASRAWAIAGTSGGEMRVYLGDGTTTKKEYNGSISIDDDAWNLIGFTYDSGVLKCYVNGTEDTSVTKSVDDAYTSMSAASNAVMIGARKATSSTYSNLWDGLLDEAMFFNTALSGAEVSELYNSGSGLAYPFASGTNLKINIGNAWKTVAGVKINIGNAWKTVAGVKINIGNAWKTVTI